MLFLAFFHLIAQIPLGSVSPASSIALVAPSDSQYVPDPYAFAHYDRLQESYTDSRRNI